MLLRKIPKNLTLSLPNRSLTTTPNPNPNPNPQPEASFLVNLVLESDPKTLAKALNDPSIQWSQTLVDQTLKLLWNHAPKALQFFRAVAANPRHALSASSFDHAVDLAARLRDHRGVWALVARMRALRLGPTPKTLAIVAERYVTAKKPDKAVKVFLSMHHHGCPQDLSSFNSLLDSLCKSKHVEKAHNLLRAFRRKFKVDVISYNTIANGYCLIKRPNKGIEVLEEMIQRGLSPNLISFNIMLKGYFRANQIKEAWEFFLEMKRRRCDIDVVTYTTLIHGFGVAGEVARARKVFDGMVGAGVPPSPATYNALIQILCKKDSVENAAAIFAEMPGKNVTTFAVMIRGFLHAGKTEQALELLAGMAKLGLRPNVQIYNVVIRYLCEAGEIERAFSYFDEMGSGECLPNLDTYNVLIGAMFVRRRSEDLVAAGKLVIEMVDRGFVPRRLTLSRVLDGLLLTGNQVFAKEILRLQSWCGRLPRQLRF